MHRRPAETQKMLRGKRLGREESTVAERKVEARKKSSSGKKQKVSKAGVQNMNTSEKCLSGKQRPNLPGSCKPCKVIWTLH